MPAYSTTVAAATAVIGYDLLQELNIRTSNVDRVVTGIGHMGSAAAGDAISNLKVGQSTEARIINRTTGFPNMDDVQPLEVIVPAGAPLGLIVEDAPATNPLNTIIIVEDIL